MPHDGITDSDLQSVVAYYGQFIARRAGPGFDMACSDVLERTALDYTLDSLRAIDGYLLTVHGALEDIPTIAYANTIMGVAVYVGEVIRRRSPSMAYRWGRKAETQGDDPASGLAFGDLLDIVLLDPNTGAALSPVEPILRVFLHGQKAHTVHSFAVTATRSAWMAAVSDDYHRT